MSFLARTVRAMRPSMGMIHSSIVILFFPLGTCVVVVIVFRICPLHRRTASLPIASTALHKDDDEP